VDWFLRQARRRGVMGGSRPWAAVWALILAVRLARRFTKRKPEILYSTKLGPGESVLVTALPPDVSGTAAPAAPS
jgi:hypothetical protein